MGNPTNTKKYNHYDKIMIFLYIGNNNGISRKNLSEYFKIGEGSTKSILKDLENSGLIIKTKQGSVISIKGKKIFNQISKIFLYPQKLDYDIFKDDLDVYILILNEFDNSKINQLYLGRDYAIRCGCQSAMILKKEKNTIKIPLINDYNFNELKNYIQVKNNDIIIVASSTEIRTTLRGILSIVNCLSKSFNKIFFENFE